MEDKAGGSWVVPKNLVLAPGVYCNKIKITIQPDTGATATNVAFVAPDIAMSNGNVARLTGYTGIYSSFGGLVFDAYSGDINWSSSNKSWTGAVFAPNGQAQISGSGSTGTCAGVQANACGFVEGLTVQMPGSGGSWAGLGAIVGGTSTTTTSTYPVTTISTPTTVVGTTNSGSTTPNVTVPGTTNAGTTNFSTTTVGTGAGLDE